MARGSLLLALLIGFPAGLLGQNPFGSPPPVFVSPEISKEGKITFRLHAPKAGEVKLGGSDLPGLGFGGGPALKKGDNGVWETTIGPVAPGSYRYLFVVDGLAVVDPRNTQVSETNSQTFSLVHLPGSASDTKTIPHGAVAAVHYHSKTLDKPRRLHVYTPPGYEKSTESYPVLYLLHGAMDCDHSWSTVGRAGFILDHLIASGKAKPMVVVMPHGHTGPFRFGGPAGENTFEKQMAEFVTDFANDIRPLVESRYRLKSGTANRAIAGLSMGGAQTLDIAFANLADFGYIGVFSSGIFGIVGGPGGGAANNSWEQKRLKVLDDPELKKGVKKIWFAIGKDDFLLKTSQATVDMLRKHKFEVASLETDGGHTWTKWRDYLGEFAPLLFQ